MPIPACPTLDGGPDYLVSISGLRLTNARRNVADSSGGAIFTEHSLALDSMIIDNSIALECRRRLFSASSIPGNR